MIKIYLSSAGFQIKKKNDVEKPIKVGLIFFLLIIESRPQCRVTLLSMLFHQARMERCKSNNYRLELESLQNFINHNGSRLPGEGDRQSRAPTTKHSSYALSDLHISFLVNTADEIWLSRLVEQFSHTQLRSSNVNKSELDTTENRI